MMQPIAPPAPPPAQSGFQDDTPLTQDQRILHALGRLGFGARPGDLEKVKQMGLGAYIARQLQPENIDDSAVERTVRNLPGAMLTADEIGQREREMLLANVNAVQVRKQLEDAARESGVDTSGEMNPMQLLQKLPGEAAGADGRYPERGAGAARGGFYRWWACCREVPAGGAERAPASGSLSRFLVQPLQHRHGQSPHHQGYR
ncbi:MAG: DUF1800 family protein [Armatimonas sp.]